jgi:uncharacterized protein
VLIAVVSDTHRDTYCINKILKKVEKADVLIHLGDNISDVEEIERNYKGKILAVRGNCDFGSMAKSELLEEIGGKKIFITHGHKYDVKYGLSKLLYRAEELGANIALYGHTHISSVEYERGVWLINPGSVGDARDGCESFALIEIGDRGIHTSIVTV